MNARANDNKHFFNSLQIFRGIAALMVVFHHEWRAFVYFYGAESEIFGFLAGLGKYGVDFFFVLSGFIITYSNYDKAGKLSETRTYVVNRVLRIYLPFLPVSLLMLLLYFMFPTVSEGEERDISLLTSLTLVPAGKPALTVAWTLVHEMMFYLLFLSWFFSKRFWYCIAIVWVLIIIYLNYFATDFKGNQSSFLKYFGSNYNLEFIMGFLSAIVLKYRGIRYQKIFLFAGILIILSVVLLKWIDREASINPGTNLVLALGFGCTILGNIGTRLDKKSSRSLLMILGNASYSIYLVHNPSISILVRTFLRLPAYVPSFIVFIIIFSLCCIVGIIYSKIFEEYFLKLLKKKLIPGKKDLRAKTEVVL
jgi:hypothetical protein